MTEIVFIGGAGRSGTTFLAHQLARFAGIHTPGESQWVTEIIERRIPENELVSFASKHWKVIQAPVRISKQDWAELDCTARNRSRAAFISALMSRLAGGEGIVVDHTPVNLAKRRALLSVFPDARFLHLVRDGRAVFASLKRVTWGPSTPPEAAQYWESFIGKGVLAELTMERAVIRVHYEDIVTDPDRIRSLAAELLHLDSSTLVEKPDHNVPLAGYTRKQHALVNSPPDPGRLRSWESRLSSAELRAFEYFTASTLTSLGYPLTQGHLQAPSHRRRLYWATEEYLRFALLNPARNIARTRGAHLRGS